MWRPVYKDFTKNLLFFRFIFKGPKPHEGVPGSRWFYHQSKAHAILSRNRYPKNFLSLPELGGRSIWKKWVLKTGNNWFFYSTGTCKPLLVPIEKLMVSCFEHPLFSNQPTSELRKTQKFFRISIPTQNCMRFRLVIKSARSGHSFVGFGTLENKSENFGNLIFTCCETVRCQGPATGAIHN